MVNVIKFACNGTLTCVSMNWRDFMNDNDAILKHTITGIDLF